MIRILNKILTLSRLPTLRNTENDIFHLLANIYVTENLYKNPKYSDPKKLNLFEHQVYSQNGEDGIIDEIFSRIGEESKIFVEFGVGNGLQNNTAYLLLKNWKGFWLEANDKQVKKIESKFQGFISEGKLSVKKTFITAENIEILFNSLAIPKNIDLLSIDIDGNDYWVWKAIANYSPRVVVIEYNSLFPKKTQWIMKYNPCHTWDGSCYFNSSLKSLELLGKDKGYSLVGCDFSGANAFFVRKDLVSNKFHEPFTAENHYEPSRYFLSRNTGHLKNIGKYEK